MSVAIIYQDDSFLVLNKPSGMTVNRADTTKDEKTLQDWVEKNIKYQISNIKNAGVTRVGDPRRAPGMNMKPSDGGDKRQDPEGKQEKYNILEEFRSRGGIVHRLDKETSGVILVARTPESFGQLKKQFMEKTVTKTYIALAHGRVEPIEGEINVPVGRLEFNRKRFGVVAGGREAVTRYRVIHHYVIASNAKQSQKDRHALRTRDDEKFSLVELYPQTGRTHQIRVHLKHIGHPIFADLLYAGRKTSRNGRKLLPRLFLHAEKISFFHPKTGVRVEYKADLPKDLSSFLSKLK